MKLGRCFPTRRASCTRTTPLINFTPPATLASLGLSAHLFCSGRSRFSTRCSCWKQRPRDFVEKQPTDIKNQGADQRPAGKQERGSRPEQSDRLAACRRQNETKQDDDPRLRPMRPSECTRDSQTSFKGKSDLLETQHSQSTQGRRKTNQQPQEAFNNLPLTMWKRSRQPHHILGQPDLFLLSDWLSVVSAAKRAFTNTQLISRVKNKKPPLLCGNASCDLNENHREVKAEFIRPNLHSRTLSVSVEQ